MTTSTCLTNPTAEEVLDFLIGWQCCGFGEGDFIVAKFETHCEGKVRVVFELDENGKRKFHYVDLIPE
jgi:hypothetical protein